MEEHLRPYILNFYYSRFNLYVKDPLAQSFDTPVIPAKFPLHPASFKTSLAFNIYLGLNNNNAIVTAVPVHFLIYNNMAVSDGITR